MTSSAQHIALLTALGWTDLHRREGGQLYGRNAAYQVIPGFMSLDGYYMPPDLSLDLCALVEPTLTDDEFKHYEALCYDAVADAMPETPLSLGGVPFAPLANGRQLMVTKGYIRGLSATKEQRREAFLRVRALWRDDQ